MMVMYSTLGIWTIGILVSVALLTLMERKLLGAAQRRLGPDSVGVLGLLQPIADAIKLLGKRSTSTHSSSFLLFYIGPSWALIVTLTAWGQLTSVIVPSFSAMITVIESRLSDYNWLVLLAILSLTIYTALLLGWSANSSYSIVGSLRSSSALISYELILATTGLIPMIIADSYNLISVLHSQELVINLLPLLPVSIMFIISILAETSRVPFDLIEAESELVSGYMTEHTSIPFVLLFLTEYASILLFSLLNSYLWLGPSNYIAVALDLNILLSLIILARAVLPRIRYDQLILTCWLQLLPIIFTIAVLVPTLAFRLLH